ncbi:concanavalin A-like lectin/glucanase [Suhomyces tanzawaensis NRRL Y-17324]|uniref:Concanavalin A-like lectin/glucanase n=1 Tax=Suhomyces tanzawaensis NRRL Y-17324 TaxID=984487 RepID=A0A1E4SR61_9ASCO|nr:concanavalin A-like lectin/glucanase [Suhomyces tanzawaensis NRRL Y-17324]ODV82003.1 concanavalin A-like lectin/glucanase [Suhomyces tanzawaensis NRRL Y-17324]
MSFVRSRPVQAVTVIILLVLGYFFLFSGSDDAFSPEELNSILQNKESNIVSLKKTELTAQGLSAPFLEPRTYKINGWETAGGTMIKNNDYIRLTSDNPRQVGNIFAKVPIQAESFEMELTFHIQSKSPNFLFGDGFAIWFIDQKSEIGDVFGAKNNFNGLGVFIDTYKNGKRGNFPFVNLMMGDGHSSYRKESDGFETRLAGCTARDLVNPRGKYSKMRLVYIKDGYLSIDFNPHGKHEEWTNCVTLTDVHLPVVKYLGLSAETGELSQSVDVIENKIFALYKEDGSFVGSVEELETMIQQQKDIDEDIKVITQDQTNESKGGRNRLFKKKSSEQRRKSLARLKMAEKRLKEREKQLRLEKYGDSESTFIKRTLSRLLTAIKYLIYLVVVVLAVWIAFIIYRVQTQKKKGKTTGLLD